MALKVRRDNENKIHEHLYTNLYLLSQFYPTSADFNRIFKKDMFMKNNKAAFFEVVYYLLYILDPERTRQKLTMWPPFDIKREIKFRAEVLNYINELNVLYDYTEIPQIMQSHLICPGGYKFTKFMFKLSELVIFEHLQKYNMVELYCPTPHTNYSFHTTYCENQTATINSIVNDKIELFNKYYFEGQNKAKRIDDNLSEINKNILNEKTKNIKAKEQFNINYPLYPSLQSLQEKNESLKMEWSNLQPVHDLFKSCGGLIKHLSSNNLILEHKKEEFRVPNEITHIIKNIEELDLIEYFQGLNILLEHRALDLPNITTSAIDRNIPKLNQMITKYVKLAEVFTEKKQQIQTTLSELLENIEAFEETPEINTVIPIILLT